VQKTEIEEAIRTVLSSECTDLYARKMLDTADIVREAILQQRARGVSK